MARATHGATRLAWHAVNLTCPTGRVDPTAPAPATGIRYHRSLPHPSLSLPPTIPHAATHARTARHCHQVHELIRLVRPEVVAVELCKERLGLLVDPEEEIKGPKVWHSRKVRARRRCATVHRGGCWTTPISIETS